MLLSALAMVLGVAVIIFVAVTIGMRGINGTNTQKSQCNSVYINFFLCLFCSQRCSNEKWDERSLLLRHLKFSHEEGCQFDDEKAQTRRRDSQVRLNVLFLFVLFSATDLKKKTERKRKKGRTFPFFWLHSCPITSETQDLRKKDKNCTIVSGCQ